MERRAFSPLTLFCQALTARKGEGKVLRPKGREGGWRKEKFVYEDSTSRDKGRGDGLFIPIHFRGWSPHDSVT